MSQKCCIKMINETHPCQSANEADEKRSTTVYKMCKMRREEKPEKQSSKGAKESKVDVP